MIKKHPGANPHWHLEPTHSSSPLNRAISRRRFIAGAIAALLAGCRPAQPLATPTPIPTATDTPALTPTATATPVPTATATATPDATATPLHTPTVTATARATRTRAATATPASQTQGVSRVALAQASDYSPTLIRQQVRALLDGLGGLKDVVSAGDKVAIKVNLTGGTHFKPPAGTSAIESYLTHPEVVHALGELLRDAGARELYIVEAIYDSGSFRLFGYEAVAKALGATLIDLNAPRPYTDFATVPVGDGWYVYKDFAFNHILQEVDTFISVAKMKCHCSAGVTHSLKNLVGLVPISRYRLNPDDWWRSALHGSGSQTRTRLPQVIMDLNRARPIHLALIDGIKTSEAGEVPRGRFAPVEAGMLLAGKDPVAADAVATAAMGFDPTANYPAAPFVTCENYLNMAYKLGLGTNRLDEIEVVGAAIQDVQLQFMPC